MRLRFLTCVQGYPLKKICQYAAKRDFTDVMVFNEDNKTVNGLVVVHLPDGPTAHFRLNRLVLRKAIKVSFSACSLQVSAYHCIHYAPPSMQQQICISRACERFWYLRRLVDHHATTNFYPSCMFSSHMPTERQL